MQRHNKDGLAHQIRKVLGSSFLSSSGNHEQDLRSNRKTMQFISCTSWKCDRSEKGRQM